MTESIPRTPRRHRGLDVLRVVAIVGVVSIHTFGALRTSPEIQGTASWWVAVALNAGFIWAVPVFVMISGALLLGERPHRHGPMDFYRRRLMRLAPAFVFWQVFYLIVVRQWLSGLHEGPGAIAALLLRGEPYTHLYFLWLIVGLYIVSPVLRAFMSGGGRRRAVMLAAGALLITVLTYSSAALLTWAGHPTRLTLLALTQWVPYVGYFVAGYALRDVRLKGAALAACAGVVILALAWTVFQAGAVPPGSFVSAALSQSYLGPVTVVLAIALFVGVNSVFRSEASAGHARILVTLSDATFGVYLVHFVLLILVRSLPWFSTAATTSVATGTLVWVIVVVLSFAIVIPLRRVPFIRRLF
ncbi:acyltransferase [Microbacterium hydrocarbonoxydans]|uniref:acyltransferase n=1 Tax=Microbacterium hydrocarbonoxydans TaxID=273678 RepID=UPI0013DA2D07|nr:acyltransferase family protein [Microbacterium hydrocarbonoxydans]